MNIYLLKEPVEDGWGYYCRAAVIIAKSEKAARIRFPNKGSQSKRESLKVTLLGQATKFTGPGVVLAEMNITD